MLTVLETFFVRLLRGTVILTASLSFAVAVVALAYAGYARFVPVPTAALSNRVLQIREALDPVNLIKQVFPDDSDVTKEVSANPDNSRYSFYAASDTEIFNEFNKFLDISINGSFESQKQFSDWLSDNTKYAWDNSIDNTSATNEDNVNLLWRSLLFDYAKRLTARANVLAGARKKKLYSDAFDSLTAPTSPSNAPYFLAWYFSTLQNELRYALNDLAIAKAKVSALRLTVPVALYVAGGAFGYFICVMLLFLIISIEASLRRTAESAGGPIRINEISQL